MWGGARDASGGAGQGTGTELSTGLGHPGGGSGGPQGTVAGMRSESHLAFRLPGTTTWTPPEAADQYGVFTRMQAELAGLTRRQVGHRIATGAWRHVLGRGFVLASQEVGHFQRAAAGLLTWPDACLWGPSALATWHAIRPALAPAPPEQDVVHLAVPCGRKSWPDLQAHKIDVPSGRVHGCLRIQLPFDACIDSMAFLPLCDAEAIAAWTMTRETMTLDRFDSAIAAHSGRPGVRQLLHLRRLFSTGASSEAEYRVHLLFHRHGIVGWEANVRIELPGGWIRADILFPLLKHIVEIDGHRHHSSRQAFHDDRGRDLNCSAFGYHVTRLTWDAIVNHPDELITNLRRTQAHLASRIALHPEPALWIPR